MRRQLTALALIVALTGVVTLLPASAATARAATTAPVAQAGGIAVPINVTRGPLNFVGTLNVTGFAAQAGQLVALGTVTGTLTNTVTGVSTVVTRTFRTVVGIIGTPQATCDILHLELGPIDLNLLGLIVHVDKIVIDIDADPGGGLLGQLLCGIARALDPLNLNTLARLLTQLLGLLG